MLPEREIVHAWDATDGRGSTEITPLESFQVNVLSGQSEDDMHSPVKAVELFMCYF